MITKEIGLTHPRSPQLIPKLCGACPRGMHIYAQVFFVILTYYNLFSVLLYFVISFSETFSSAPMFISLFGISLLYH